MKNSKKGLLALGLVLWVGVGVSNNAWAMEKMCTRSPEITELHNVIAEELMRWGGLESILRTQRIQLGRKVYVPLDVFALMDNIAGYTVISGYLRRRDFLGEKPTDIIRDLQNLITILNSISVAIEQTRKEPGAPLKLKYKEAYHAIDAIVPKLEKLLNLIINACGK